MQATRMVTAAVREPVEALGPACQRPHQAAPGCTGAGAHRPAPTNRFPVAAAMRPAWLSRAVKMEYESRDPSLRTDGGWQRVRRATRRSYALARAGPGPGTPAGKFLQVVRARLQRNVAGLNESSNFYFGVVEHGCKDALKRVRNKSNV